MVLTTPDFRDGELLNDLLEQVEEEITAIYADGAYESFDNYEFIASFGARAVILPRKGSKIRHSKFSQATTLARDEVLRDLRKMGKAGWKKHFNYHKRNLVETSISRLKTVLGDRLKSRLFESQLAEATLMSSILNTFTALGMPDSQMI